MFIDTHTHLFSDAFDQDRTEVVQQAINAGVEICLLPNIDIDTIEAMNQLARQFPTNCFAMMGLHPGSVDEHWEKKLEVIKKHLFSEKYIAVGEIGMDLYWDKSFVDAQRTAFRMQVEWAKELELPIAIHAREAFQEIYEVLDEINDDRLTGVFHCFTGTLDQANRAIQLGFKLGIGGVVTFKNGGIDKFLNRIDLKHIVVETDSPYLAPVPYRPSSAPCSP